MKKCAYLNAINVNEEKLEMRPELVEPRIKKLLNPITHFDEATTSRLNDKIKILPHNWAE